MILTSQVDWLATRTSDHDTFQGHDTAESDVDVLLYLGLARVFELPRGAGECRTVRLLQLRFRPFLPFDDFKTLAGPDHSGGIRALPRSHGEISGVPQPTDRGTLLSAKVHCGILPVIGWNSFRRP